MSTLEVRASIDVATIALRLLWIVGPPDIKCVPIMLLPTTLR
jgi:hypothetical protein